MLTYFVIVPILIAVFLSISPSAKIGRFIVIAVQTALVGFAVYLFSICKEGDVVTVVGNYGSVLGILLRADSLSSVFVLLTTFIFLIATVYSFHENNKGLFWFLLFIWEGVLIGILLSRDLFNIFVLLEVVTVAVSLLIMFNRDNRSMYDGMIYLMINTVAVQFYLFGVGYIYRLTGALDMEVAARALKTFEKVSLILPYSLIMVAISLKCALVPLFNWLPKAHGTPSAPSSVSAILSGVHIKSSVYLFLRCQALFQEIALSEFFLLVGIITGIAGFVIALSQSDIKLILAFSTISQIGLIMIGLNIADTYTFSGGLYHIINHALFKSALFLSAGMITHAYGIRDIYKIRGVLRQVPLVGVATIMAILGITGVPLFNGSISKYFLVGGANWLVSSAIILINLGTITVFIKYSSILFGRPGHKADITKIDGCQQTTVLVLGALCFIGGIFGEQFIEIMFNIRVSVNPAGFLQKTILFVASVIAGYFISENYVRKSVLLKRIYEADLSFSGMCASVGVFFAIILVASRLFLIPSVRAFFVAVLK